MSTMDIAPETIASAEHVSGLLMVRTSIGRVLVHPIDELPVRLPEGGPRELDVDPFGKGVYVDGVPVTLTRLRSVCGA